MVLYLEEYLGRLHFTFRRWKKRATKKLYAQITTYEQAQYALLNGYPVSLRIK